MLFLVLRRELDLTEFGLHVRVFNFGALDVRKDLFRLFDPAFGDKPSGALGKPRDGQE